MVRGMARVTDTMEYLDITVHDTMEDITSVDKHSRRFGDRAFAVAAPRVWNSLPTDIKLHQSTTTSSKRRLKTVLFNRGFAEYT